LSVNIGWVILEKVVFVIEKKLIIGADRPFSSKTLRTYSDNRRKFGYG